MADFIANPNGTFDQLVGFMDLHSYSQIVAYPYAYDCIAEPHNEETLVELAYGMTSAMKSVHGMHYTVESACKKVGSSKEENSGSALDWMTVSAGAHWSYSIHLRDTGIHGFLLPASEIIPQGEEMKALLVMYIEFLIEYEL